MLLLLLLLRAVAVAVAVAIVVAVVFTAKDDSIRHRNVANGNSLPVLHRCIHQNATR